ncbi:MAG: insulinase family protein [Deltaproteobacteria bacterium]|nr:insulinase family protein [Deltaproteobacteria bacterium]
MRCLPLWSLCFVLLPAVPGAAQSDGPAVETAVDTLPNGLTVITVEDHAAPVVSFQVWVRTGSKNERPGITGVSHLFEHMMFKGSRKYGPEEHARIVQGNGGVPNAFTTRDFTAYYDDFPSDRLELAVQLEAERFQNLSITEENLKSEREVVKEERRLRTDNTPTGKAVEELLATVYKAHPYSWPVVGWMSDLDALTLADCREYFRAHYAPNNAVIVVAGDTTPAEVMKLVRRHFGRWRRQPPAAPVPTRDPEQKGERRVTLRMPAQAPLILGGWHVPAAAHADLAVLEVISNLLSNGKSSRLYQRLVHTDQTATAAAGGVFRLEHPGVFYAYAMVKPGEDPKKVEDAYLAEVEKLKTEPIADTELQKVRNQLESGHVFGLKRVHALGQEVAEAYLLEGSVDAFKTRLARWRAVTPADIQRVARTYFTVDNRTLITVLPDNPPPKNALR